METQLLRNILEESTSPYIKFKGIKANNTYIDIEVMYTNKAYIELNDKINLSNNEILIISILKDNNLNINSILELTSKNNIYKINTNIKYLNKNYKLNFFSSCNEEFYCEIKQIDSYNMYLNDMLQNQNHIEVFTQLANNIDDTIYVRDEEKLLYLSPSFKNKNNFSSELLFKDIRHWIKEWDKVEFTKHPSDYFDKNITIDTYKVTKGDKENWYTNKSIPIFDKDDNIKKRICIISNITKFKNQQEILEQQRLDFFANLSHELRTPINLVLSSLEVLKLRLDRLSVGDQEYFERYLRIINQNGLRLLKLVNNLIDTTKIESGHFTFEPRNYDIVSFVESICMSVSDFVKQKDMEIIFDTNVEENLLSFDLDNMERIILNLLSNAIKFNSKQGKIEVAINCGDNVTISVKDEGIGIPEDNLKKIFDRFEQVEDKLKINKEGSGIGLSLVKSLVEIHHGSITVNSELGKGSEFIVTIPNVTRKYTKKEENINNYNNVNMMKVEFSDIYS